MALRDPRSLKPGGQPLSFELVFLLQKLNRCFCEGDLGVGHCHEMTLDLHCLPGTDFQVAASLARERRFRLAAGECRRDPVCDCFPHGLREYTCFWKGLTIPHRDLDDIADGKDARELC